MRWKSWIGVAVLGVGCIAGEAFSFGVDGLKTMEGGRIGGMGNKYVRILR